MHARPSTVTPGDSAPISAALAHGVQAPMSFLSGAVLSGGSTRLHVARQPDDEGKTVRRNKSHGGFLSPLSKLARSSVQSISEVVGSHYSAPVKDALDEDADQRQILYLRLKNVGTPGSGCSLSHANSSHRPRPTANGKPQPRISTYWKETTHGKTKTSRPSTMQRWSRHVSGSWTRHDSAVM